MSFPAAGSVEKALFLHLRAAFWWKMIMIGVYGQFMEEISPNAPKYPY
jgi:hypothetical protein